MKILTILLLIIGLPELINAQVKIPEPSPTAVLSQDIGLSKICIQYGRPSAKRRKVFGGIVPYDTVWRTGANHCTVVSFDTDLYFEGHRVDSGAYALFTIPRDSVWTIILNKESDQWGAFRYDPAADVIRFDVETETLNQKIETFDISFQNLTDSTAQLVLSWENTSVPIMVRSNLDVMMTISIEKMIAENSQNSWDYYFAAQYYFNNKGNATQALAWMKKSIALDPIFWTVFNYADMLEKSGKLDQALKIAKQSLALSKAANEHTFIDNQVQPMIDRLSEN